MNFDCCVYFHLKFIIAVLDEFQLFTCGLVNHFIYLITVIGFYFKLCLAVLIGLQCGAVRHFCVVHTQDLSVFLRRGESHVIERCFGLLL